MLEFLARLTHELQMRHTDPREVKFYVPAHAWDAFCRTTEELFPKSHWVNEAELGETGEVQLMGFKFCKVVDLGEAP